MGVEIKTNKAKKVRIAVEKYPVTTLSRMLSLQAACHVSLWGLPLCGSTTGS